MPNPHLGKDNNPLQAFAAGQVGMYCDSGGKFLKYIAGDEFASSFFLKTAYLPTTKSSVKCEDTQKLLA